LNAAVYGRLDQTAHFEEPLSEFIELDFKMTHRECSSALNRIGR
jgi:hypothetical protein